MAGTNFLQVNPNAANQEDDPTYLADSLRTGGAATNALLPSPLFNKQSFQSSIMITALATALVNKGYSPNDGSAAPGTALNNLVAVLTNIMTQADMAPFARLLSPVFTGTPQAPTPPVADNSAKLATTAFVRALASQNFAISLGINGYVKFPAFLGGLIIQWMRGPSNPAGGETSFTLNFPLPFPTAVAIVQLTPQTGASQDNDMSYQIYGAPTNSSVTVYLQEFSNGRATACVCHLLAIGY